MYLEEQTKVNDFGQLQRAQSPVAEGSVPREYSDLNRHLDTVRGLVGAIEERLQPVLRGAEPKVVDNETKSAREQPRCSLADSIRCDADGLANVAFRLSDILQRIEL